MSKIKRLKLEINSFDFDADMVEDPNGSYVEYRAYQAKIKELESQLEQAKKDQARYYWMQDWIENRVRATKEFLRAKTRSDFDKAIDAAMQEGK